MVLTPRGKVLATAALFAGAVVMVAVAAVGGTAGPLFAAWVPLVGVAWVLTRPDVRTGGEGVDQERGSDGPGIDAGLAPPADPDARA